MLLTLRNIKLYTPRTSNINNHPLLPLHDYEEYDACYFVEEDDNFPGYVKLLLAKLKTNCAYLNHCTRMNVGKLYLSHSMVMDSLYWVGPIVRYMPTDLFQRTCSYSLQYRQ
jgi:hypothetical protein